MLRETPLDADLFPLHSPVNYVNWLGAQKKRVVVLTQVHYRFIIDSLSIHYLFMYYVVLPKKR